MARIAGKLTARSMGWDRKALADATASGISGEGDDRVVDGNVRVKLGRIVGIVAGLHQTVNNDTGEIQTGLKGQFRGISTALETGDGPDKGKAITVTAGRCYLPSGLQDMIEGALAVAREREAKATVQFGIDLFAVPALNNAGYTFDAERLIDMGEADPLELLLAAADGAPAPSDGAGDKAAEQPAGASGDDVVTGDVATGAAAPTAGKGKGNAAK